jgi:hypothetical protein
MLTVGKLITLQLTLFPSSLPKSSPPEIRALIPLERYLDVLVEEYPHSIRPVDLATKTIHSKAAVSKLRGKLLKLCDEKTMALDRGFLLKPDLEVLASLFQVYALTGRHKEFLSSRFVKELFESERFHRTISALFPPYDRYFVEEDTAFLTDKLLDIVANIDPEELRRVIRILSSGPTRVTAFALGMSFSKILERVHFSIDSKDELRRVITIRDKLFYLVRDFLWTRIDDMRIFKRIDLAQKRKYLSVYKDTIDFYLRQYFELTTKPIMQAAIASGISKVPTVPPLGSAVLVYSDESSQAHR